MVSIGFRGHVKRTVYIRRVSLPPEVLKDNERERESSLEKKISKKFLPVDHRPSSQFYIIRRLSTFLEMSKLLHLDFVRCQLVDRMARVNGGETSSTFSVEKFRWALVSIHHQISTEWFVSIPFCASTWSCIQPGRSTLSAAFS